MMRQHSMAQYSTIRQRERGKEGMAYIKAGFDVGTALEQCFHKLH
jgi:hypothetical protein